MKLETLPSSTPSRVAIIGGGLAGLAAACALADAGLSVHLFERKPFLGGRASSYEHPGTGEVVDNCQHVLLGCCTNLLDFYRRIGSNQLIRWYDRLNFVEPGGRRSVIAASSLPAPFHTSPTFLTAHALSLTDKLAIARAMLAMMSSRPNDNGHNFKQWLKSHGQTDQAIRRFWEPVVVSALNEDTDRLSVAMASMVFRDAFLKSAEAGRMGLPTVPLTELYARAGQYIEARGGRVHLRAAVEDIDVAGEHVRVHIRDGQSLARKPASAAAHSDAFGPEQDREGHGFSDQVEDREGHGFSRTENAANDSGAFAPEGLQFDYLILATPVFAVSKLLPSTPDFAPTRNAALHFEPSPIIGIHLWFDREITQLDHAVLLDRTIQWMFHKSRILSRFANASSGTNVAPARSRRPAIAETPSDETHNSQLTTQNSQIPTGSYLELVVSSSKSLVEKPRQEIIDLAVRELADFFPIVRDAQLTKATVVKEIHATFSPRPGIDQFRPSPSTANPRVFLAGDWIATGWPATMEGAVRSGYMAAEALLNSIGDSRMILVPDLPACGLMRLFR